jgi:hypothetical protein
LEGCIRELPGLKARAKLAKERELRVKRYLLFREFAVPYPASTTESWVL